MNEGLFFQFIGLTLLSLLISLIVKRFNVDALDHWDYIAFFFAGPLWFITFPCLFIYLGVYHVNHRKT